MSDVMRAYGGAVVSELVGTYMLFLLSEKYNKKISGIILVPDYEW